MNTKHQKLSGVLVDYRTPIEAVESLKKITTAVYKSKKCTTLYNAVDGHPDMVLTQISDNTFICEPTVYEYYKKLIPNINLIKGESLISCTYPDDIAYNVAMVGNSSFHNFKYTDKKILEYLYEKNIKLINVKQGYSKCSICIVDDNSIITSDKSIASQAEKNGIEALYISSGQITLHDLNYGFIGGCTGKLSSDKLAVCGNLKYHSDYDKIIDFCNSKNVEVIMLADMKPFDIGTIIPIFDL